MRRHAQRLSHRFLAKGLALTAVLAITMPFVILACAQQPDTSSPATHHTSDTTKPAIGGDAMKAYKDPKTGKLGTPPDSSIPPESSEAAKTMTSTTPEELQEEPAPAGGTMVDLKGRFDSSMTATKDKSGAITKSHSPNPQHN